MTGKNLWQNPDAAAGALYTRLANKRTFTRIFYTLIVVAILYNLYSSSELRKTLDDRLQPKVEPVRVIQETEPNLQWPEDVLFQRNGTEKATMVMLVRNREIREALSSMRSVEDRFNRKFHYPWTFLNDKPFTKEVGAPASSLHYILGVGSDMADSLSNTRREWLADQWNTKWYRKSAGQCRQPSTWLWQSTGW